MAIVISGAGTITGIAEGGLPDGSVAAADIKDGAVTAVKIADDAVTTAKIADGEVTMAKLATSGTLPALDGSALTGLASAAGAVDFYTSTSTLTTTSQSLIPLTGYSITMTPADANSKFLLLFGGGHYSAGDWTEFSFYRGTTKLNSNKGFYASNYSNPVNMNYLDSPATTSSVTYNIYWRSWASGIQVEFPWGQDGTFVVLEILG